MNVKTQNVMFSSAKDEWATPQDFYDGLNNRYNFTLDPCATAPSEIAESNANAAT